MFLKLKGVDVAHHTILTFKEDENLNGVFNLCVPKPTDNKSLMKSLRKVLKAPFGIPQSKNLY